MYGEPVRVYAFMNFTAIKCINFCKPFAVLGPARLTLNDGRHDRLFVGTPIWFGHSDTDWLVCCWMCFVQARPHSGVRFFLLQHDCGRHAGQGALSLHTHTHTHTCEHVWVSHAQGYTGIDDSVGDLEVYKNTSWSGNRCFAHKEFLYIIVMGHYPWKEVQVKDHSNFKFFRR